MTRPLHHLARELRREERDRFAQAARTLARRLDTLPDDHPDRPKVAELRAAALAARDRLDDLAADGR